MNGPGPNPSDSAAPSAAWVPFWRLMRIVALCALLAVLALDLNLVIEEAADLLQGPAWDPGSAAAEDTR